MRISMTCVALLALPLLAAGPAEAASVLNMASESQTIVVSDGSGRTEMSIPPGESVQFCQDGCLVVLPDGEQQALTGAESIVLPPPPPDDSDNSGG